jgi:hypothetical protein
VKPSPCCRRWRACRHRTRPASRRSRPPPCSAQNDAGHIRLAPCPLNGRNLSIEAGPRRDDESLHCASEDHVGPHRNHPRDRSRLPECGHRQRDRDGKRVSISTRSRSPGLAPRPVRRRRDGERLLHAAYATFVISLNARAGLASYDVRIADSSMLARHRAAWVRPAKLQAVPATDPDATPRLTRHLARGRVKCVSVRARDVTGATGAWSHGSCAIRGLDDAALVIDGPHRIVREPRYWAAAAPPR